jgi:hypothetical protein
MAGGPGNRRNARSRHVVAHDDWHLRRGFLMLRRYRRGRLTYYTNDAMILAWQIGEAKTDLEARRPHVAARKAAK